MQERNHGGEGNGSEIGCGRRRGDQGFRVIRRHDGQEVSTVQTIEHLCREKNGGSRYDGRCLDHREREPIEISNRVSTEQSHVHDHFELDHYQSYASDRCGRQFDFQRSIRYQRTIKVGERSKDQQLRGSRRFSYNNYKRVYSRVQYNRTLYAATGTTDWQ